MNHHAIEITSKKFTQPQLFACLVLKEFLQLDFRKLAALLGDAEELRAAIDLKKTPHFTTFQKASQRLLRTTPAQQLIHKTLRLAQVTGKLKPRVRLAAGDGTGFESRHVSQ